MTDGYDYDFVILDDDEFTIIRGDKEYTYSYDKSYLITGAESNNVPTIDNRHQESEIPDDYDYGYNWMDDYYF